jgi:BirA family biotin operon repressor/biotin-[acetyl-CoA-carboxylase] ligase
LVRRFPSIDSTNTWLLAEARRGAAAGLVAVADHQTAGRGRLGRTWDAPPGANLLCSVLLRPEGGPSFVDVARVALAARAAAGVDVALKWPNDLLLGDAKVGGILSEVDRDALVVGLGLNVEWAPEGAARLGEGLTRDTVLDALLVALDGWLVADARVVLRAYREASATLGRSVRVELTDESFTGTAADITDTGSLLVETENCIREVSAADVIHLR